MVPPDLRLRTVYLVELVRPPDQSVVLVEEGLRGRLADVASNAVANARTSDPWRVPPIQSLLGTCRLHNVDAYTYLVNVIQRISMHPANRAIELTSRLWKSLFADDPLRSDLGPHYHDSPPH